MTGTDGDEACLVFLLPKGRGGRRKKKNERNSPVDHLSSRVEGGAAEAFISQGEEERKKRKTEEIRLAVF